uniref:Ricin B-type lectin domain-containing protein n=1 Tax=Strongyloides papillosus TaxID=174720 RepID=A0A0N5CF77_STREA
MFLILVECTTPIQVSGNNNDVRITSTVTTTADGDTVAVVTCTVRDVNANNQNNQPNQAWMNENGFGWFTTPNGDQTMVRTYKCNHETGSWYIGDTPTDAVRFVRCADREI